MDNQQGIAIDLALDSSQIDLEITDSDIEIDLNDDEFDFFIQSETKNNAQADVPSQQAIDPQEDSQVVDAEIDLDDEFDFFIQPETKNTPQDDVPSQQATEPQEDSQVVDAEIDLDDDEYDFPINPEVNVEVNANTQADLAENKPTTDTDITKTATDTLSTVALNEAESMPDQLQAELVNEDLLSKESTSNKHINSSSNSDSSESTISRIANDSDSNTADADLSSNNDDNTAKESESYSSDANLFEELSNEADIHQFFEQSYDMDDISYQLESETKAEIDDSNFFVSPTDYPSSQADTTAGDLQASNSAVSESHIDNIEQAVENLTAKNVTTHDFSASTADSQPNTPVNSSSISSSAYSSTYPPTYSSTQDNAGNNSNDSDTSTVYVEESTSFLGRVFTGLMYAVIFAIAGLFFDFAVSVLRSIMNNGDGNLVWLFTPILLFVGFVIGFFSGNNAGINEVTVPGETTSSVSGGILRAIFYSIGLCFVAWFVLMFLN